MRFLWGGVSQNSVQKMFSRKNMGCKDSSSVYSISYFVFRIAYLYGVIYKLQARNSSPSPQRKLLSTCELRYEGYSEIGISPPPLEQQPLVGQGLLIIKASRSQTHTLYDSSGRLVSPTQRLLPDNTQHSQETDIHATDGIWTRNPSKRAVADRPVRPRGLCDQNFA